MMCSVDGCTKDTYLRGWCQAHYTRWRRYGNPETRRRLTGMPWVDRLAHSFLVGDGCWEWQGSVQSEGYGTFYRGKNMKAHRVVYELLVGPIDPELTIDHLCLNKTCVRPAHLEVVTRSENIARKNRAAAGRPRKTPNPTAVPRELHGTLRERNKNGETLEQLAQEFGVNKTTIGRYVRSAA
jgi:hypothetical protein